MTLSKRYYCVEAIDGETECFVNDGFWYTEKGIIIKWIILAVFFFIFFGWFVGGRIHAKRRLRKGLPLLSYHRFLVSYQERRRFGQVPQNHFTFYQTQNPYAPPNGGANAPYTQRQDGAWSEPPPLYQNNDAPPQYFAPAGPAKTGATPGASSAPDAMEMGQYSAGAPPPAQAGPQQSGVVGSEQQSESGHVPTQPLPPRPAQAKIMGVFGRFRR
ncbi:uncharacterized protein SETTUDRAFT_160108 [Exserohilum turcica Et28A]|uniref:Uncharacterized protein n=1 Tax=Exserohilum turcicum (strain 28A) TaxID=671987 RepID=R0KI83_EXST2|nr:uncharacterized protein SETTUDRAFT_160108 [Exserohilum turcica Et28A]EOA88934.1 hypothetical protein SETTUDRAFT_160108 [Exserohilum turcica Et28A]